MSSDVFFYQLGPGHERQARALQHWSRRLGVGRLTGHRPPRGGARPHPGPEVAQRALTRTSSPTGPGRWATTSTCRWARATSPPTRCRWPWPTPRSPTAAGCCSPGSGMRIEDAAGRALQQLEAPVARKLKIDAGFRQAILEGLRGAASAGGGTSTEVFERLPGADRRQDRHRGEGPRPGRPVLVRRAGALPRPEVRGRGHRRGRRLRRRHRRADGPADPGQALQRGRAAARGRWRVCRTDGSLVRLRVPRPRGAHPARSTRCMLLATLGLVAASIYVVGTATQDDIPGDPNYFAAAPGACTRAWGSILMLLISRFDYSRLREWKFGIYAFMIASIVLVYALGATARGSRRAIEFGFFNFQASELGKLLLVLALSAFVVDRTRRLGERETTSRILLLALVPAMLVIGAAGPRARGSCTSPSSWRCCSWPARSGRTSPRWECWARPPSWWCSWLAPAVGVEVLKPYQEDRLTAFLAPHERPAQGGLPDQPVADGDRLRGEDRVAATRPPRHSSTSCPSTTPTSSSRWWARSSASWGRRSCCRCSPC